MTPLYFTGSRNFRIMIVFVLLLHTGKSYSQRGPGGVSVETGLDYGCGTTAYGSDLGMWLDASTLTSLSDGADVSDWPDMSFSRFCDDAYVPSGVFPPIFRDEPGSTINGLPTITFEDDRFFLLATTLDLNQAPITKEITVSFAFRTGDDVTTKQVLFEEGGTLRGFNVIIDDGEIIVGAYDFQRDNNDGTGGWGYTYVSRNIDPNTIYVLTAKLFVEDYPNETPASDNWQGVNTSTNYVRGWLNGVVFDNMILDQTHVNAYSHTSNDAPNQGIGALNNHPNPCGLGAVNDDMVDRDFIYDGNNTPSGEPYPFPFTGRLAEVCYYNTAAPVNNAKRIIIENYLSAKYLAPLTTQNWYDYDVAYGRDVIGIGQSTTDPNDIHNLSQGRNPFSIQALPFNSGANRYFMTGHDGGNLIYSSEQVPNNSVNIQRLERIWRVDRQSNVGAITFTLNANELPPAPSGYDIPVMLIDNQSLNFPNFALSSTQVFEIEDLGGGFYEFEYNITDKDFFTFGWARKEVSFTSATGSSFELDPPPATSNKIVQVRLNYKPLSGSPPVYVDYEFTDGTALDGSDYEFTPLPNGVFIGSGSQTGSLPFRIINDDFAEPESIENFTISLIAGPNTGSTDIGAQSNLVYSIFDDDPDPSFSFQTDVTPNIFEGTQNVTITVVRSGDVSGAPNASVTIDFDEVSSTALENSLSLPDPDDFDFTGPITLNFIGVTDNVKTFQIDTNDDLVDEEDVEDIVFKITGATGAGFDPDDPNAYLTHTVKLNDNDPLPKAQFLAASQEGFESVGDPVITVVLDRLSTKDITLPFDIKPGETIVNPAGGAAQYPADYTGFLSGEIILPPFAVEGFLGPLFIDQSTPGEDAEEIVLELVDGPAADPTRVPINATIDPLNDITKTSYIIIDYSPFEWRGAAGIGKNSDNVVWIDPDRMSLNNGDPVTKIPNLSVQPEIIDIETYNNNNNRAVFRDGSINSGLNNSLNNRNFLDFTPSNNPNNTSLTDCYLMQNVVGNSASVRINGSAVDRLAYFFVFRPNAVPTVLGSSSSQPHSDNNGQPENRVQLIYEQGGGTRGTSIYLYNNYLYFHAWNDFNSNGETPWGWGINDGNANSQISTSVWARSSQQIVNNEKYVVSCFYDANATPFSDRLRIYVNGEKGVIGVGTNTVSNFNSSSVGRLFGHTGRAGIGAILDNTRFHFTNQQGSNRDAGFDGQLGDFILFHSHQLNEARRVIIENYLSAKYCIPLDDNDTPQVFDLNFADRINSSEQDFNQEVSGLGRFNSLQVHGDAQGPSSVLRIKDPVFTGSGESYLVWGSNGRSLTETYPYSFPNAELPSTILERSGEVWRMFESPANSLTSVNVNINFSASTNAGDFNLSTNLLKLLTHTNAEPDDFSNADIYDLSSYGSGNVARFNNVLVEDGMYIALGNTSDYFSTPLPIELLSFNAELKGTYVDLDWETATEINNDYFVVERASENLDWKPILTVTGAGNSNSLLSYSEKDREPLEGLSYYRLKQVDYDGQFSYSDPVAIFNNQIENSDEVFMYPNPSSAGSVFLRIPEVMNGYRTELRLFDLSGKLLIKELYDAHSDVYEMSYGNLIPGIYLVQINSEVLNETKKLVVK